MDRSHWMFGECGEVDGENLSRLEDVSDRLQLLLGETCTEGSQDKIKDLPNNVDWMPLPKLTWQYGALKIAC